jgi:hypothetical protein
MLTELLYRLRREASRFGAPRRLEVCPPALLQASAAPAAGWRAGLRDWLSTGWHPSSNGLPRQTHSSPDPEGALKPRFCKVRDEFLQALEDIRTQQVGMLQGRIRIARSLRELWHLRPEVFKLVALHFSQAEAQCRLDRLNRHFPTRAPRSGFASLDSPAVDARPRSRR